MGFFDLQVNGYAGVDFNQDDLGAEDLHRACEALAGDKVDGILATIITEQVDRMEARIRRLVDLRERDPLAQRVIVGLHVEGPFISAKDGFRGAHPLDAVRPASEAVAARFLEAGQGLMRIVTLAPEMDDACRVTRFLSRQGVLVSAGHTDASLDELRRAIEAGLGMFTHLGNGCPMHLPRHDNIIQRALSLQESLWIGFIADGVHIPWPALGNYLRLAERAFVVTDAMAAAGLGAGLHRLGRWTVRVGDDLAARAPDGSHLVGSAMPMPIVVEKLREEAGLSPEVIERLVSRRPREAMGLA